MVEIVNPGYLKMLPVLGEEIGDAGVINLEIDGNERDLLIDGGHFLNLNG